MESPTPEDLVRVYATIQVTASELVVGKQNWPLIPTGDGIQNLLDGTVAISIWHPGTGSDVPILSSIKPIYTSISEPYKEEGPHIKTINITKSDFVVLRNEMDSPEELARRATFSEKVWSSEKWVERMVAMLEEKAEKERAEKEKADKGRYLALFAGNVFGIITLCIANYMAK